MNRDIAIPNLKEIIALEGDPELKRQLQDRLGDLLAQKQEANFGWTSVEDELPGDGKVVLVLDEYQTQREGYHHQGSWQRDTDEPFAHTRIQPTHWRRLLPLPICLRP
jgi:hypothetical protein